MAPVQRFALLLVCSASLLAVAIPSVRLSWSVNDDALIAMIYDRVEAVAWSDRPAALLCALRELTPGRLQPGLYAAWWARCRLLGFNVRAHRIGRVAMIGCAAA